MTSRPNQSQFYWQFSASGLLLGMIFGALSGIAAAIYWSAGLSAEYQSHAEVRLRPAFDESPATIPEFEHVVVGARRLKPVAGGQLGQGVRIDLRGARVLPSASSTEMFAVQCVITGCAATAAGSPSRSLLSP